MPEIGEFEEGRRRELEKSSFTTTKSEHGMKPSRWKRRHYHLEKSVFFQHRATFKSLNGTNPEKCTLDFNSPKSER